jgi:hypothetical protein
VVAENEAKNVRFGVPAVRVAVAGAELVAGFTLSRLDEEDPDGRGSGAFDLLVPDCQHGKSLTLTFGRSPFAFIRRRVAVEPRKVLEVGDILLSAGASAAAADEKPSATVNATFCSRHNPVKNRLRVATNEAYGGFCSSSAEATPALPLEGSPLHLLCGVVPQEGAVNLEVQILGEEPTVLPQWVK